MIIGRRRQRHGGRPPSDRTCTKCGARWQEPTPAGKAPLTCPTCRMATGRFEWRSCCDCGERYIIQKKAPRLFCKQCAHTRRVAGPPKDMTHDEIEQRLDAADRRSWNL